MKARLLLMLFSAPLLLRAQTPNPTNLFVAELSWRGDRLIVGKPIKLTHDEGSNSQPSFTPDGRAVVFSAVRDTGADARSDIFRIDLSTMRETRITHTAENENSPTMNSRGEYVAIRWVPATLFKEFGPWTYAADGTPKSGVLRGPDSTGYYVALPNGDYALTRPKSKSFTLGIFNAKSGDIVDVDSGIPALPAVIIPGQRAISYVRVDTIGVHHTIAGFDLASRKVTSLGPTLVGRTAHAWIAGHNTLVMAKGNTLYARGIKNTKWRVVATFDDPELRNASAYVASAKGDKLILTSPKRLTLATVVRDSLEAGRSGTDVAQMVNTWRDNGKLMDLDVTEGGISGVADDRVQKKRASDALAIQSLAISMFPKSFRAFSRLGDVQRAVGDSVAAALSYRKSLELNPRSTDAERAAATAVEKKLSASP